ncbi:hypothetical protein VTO73DRAFT_10106 [Trametes versicolor]
MPPRRRTSQRMGIATHAYREYSTAAAAALLSSSAVVGSGCSPLGLRLCSSSGPRAHEHARCQGPHSSRGVAGTGTSPFAARTGHREEDTEEGTTKKASSPNNAPDAEPHPNDARPRSTGNQPRQDDTRDNVQPRLENTQLRQGDMQPTRQGQIPDLFGSLMWGKEPIDDDRDPALHRPDGPAATGPSPSRVAVGDVPAKTTVAKRVLKGAKVTANSTDTAVWPPPTLNNPTVKVPLKDKCAQAWARENGPNSQEEFEAWYASAVATHYKKKKLAETGNTKAAKAAKAAK